MFLDSDGTESCLLGLPADISHVRHTTAAECVGFTAVTHGFYLRYLNGLCAGLPRLFCVSTRYDMHKVVTPLWTGSNQPPLQRVVLNPQTCCRRAQHDCRRHRPGELFCSLFYRLCCPASAVSPLPVHCLEYAAAHRYSYSTDQQQTIFPQGFDHITRQ